MDGGAAAGQHGGTLNMLIGRSRDVRMLVVYGYARLVAYDRELKIVPDILESIEVKDDRVFTMKLRRGHRWSDGQPFTTEDFRYFWDDVANNKELSPDRTAERPAGGRRGAQGRVPGQAHGALQLVQAQSGLPAAHGGRVAALHLPAGALPKQFHRKYNPKVTEAESKGGQQARLGGGA